LDGAGFEATSLADIAVEVAGEVDAFAGFAVAGEDAFGFGLDAAGVVDELAAVAVAGEAFDGVDL
jgi:hypoxanthine-guanine phosphoribosyltransferase